MKRINLLPPEQRVKASRERGLLWAILILVAVVVALGLVYMYANKQVGDKQAELDDLTAQTAAVQQQIAALQPYAEIQATRTSMTATARGIYDARVSWSTILQEISLVIPDNVRLQSLSGGGAADHAPGHRRRAAAGHARHHTRRHVRRHHLHPPGRGRLHDPARTHPAAHQHPAQRVRRQRRDRRPAPTSTVAFTITASLRPFLTPAPATQLAGATP